MGRNFDRSIYVDEDSTAELERNIFKAGWNMTLYLGHFWFRLALLVIAAYVVEQLLVFGNWAFHSGTWNSVIAPFFQESEWMDRMRLPITLSLIAWACTGLSLNRHPLTLAFWTSVCFCLHIMTLGAAF